MKFLLYLIGFVGLWGAFVILTADYSGGLSTDPTETSKLVLLSLVPTLVMVGFVVLIMDLLRDD